MAERRVYGAAQKTIRTGVLQYMAGGLVLESCDWLRFVGFGSQREKATDPFLSSVGVSPLRGGPAGREARRDALALGGVVRYLVSSSEPFFRRVCESSTRIYGSS